MNVQNEPIIVVGCGPAGMASALALHVAGHKVVLLERYQVSKAAGANLALWPPPIKALEHMGVDVKDLGAPVRTTLHSAKGRKRGEIMIPKDIVARYGGGFIGLLRPELYRRMEAALPKGILRVNQNVVGFEDRGDHVHVRLADGSTRNTPLLIGADGIDSTVRKGLWGDSPKREHRLHAFGGYTFETIPGIGRGVGIAAHGRTVQASYTSIRDQGRDGYQWWMVEARDPAAPNPPDLLARAKEIAKGFATGIDKVVAATPAETIGVWVLRDRKPLKQWSKGRVTIAGDAAHPTSPYAGYGAGMGIGDGYFIGKLLAGVDLSNMAAVSAALQQYDRMRIPHTTGQVQQAYVLGQMFHHMPWLLRPIRDAIVDYTPLLQMQVGKRSPMEIIAQLEEMGEGIIPIASGRKAA